MSFSICVTQHYKYVYKCILIHERKYTYHRSLLSLLLYVIINQSNNFCLEYCFFVCVYSPESSGKKVSLSCKVTNVSPAHYFVSISLSSSSDKMKKYPFNESVRDMDKTVLRSINFFLFRFIWCFITLNMEISRRLWVSLMDS